jgi:large repetitive protein
MRRITLALLLPLLAALAPAASAASPVRRSPSLPVPKLVLNEVDYDQPGIDTGEFVEIVNTGRERSRLRNVALILVNGATSTEYRRIRLSGPLAAGHRLVVAAAPVDVPVGVRTIAMPLERNNVQNGSPDGIALFDTAHKVLIDALSYEGAITSATFTGMHRHWSLVSGTAASEADDNLHPGSLCRSPDRTDTGDDEHDWGSCSATPGAPNAP